MKRDARRGGKLRVGLEWAVDIIDPPVSFGGWNTGRVVQQIFESLVEDDLEDEESPYTRLVPALSRELNISPDGCVYTFNLRENVRFHDGTPFDAAAVVFNLERIIRQDAPHFSAVAADYNRVAMRSVKEVRALDPLTVEIVLREPFAEFLRYMTQEDAPGSIVFISPTALKKYGNEGIADHAPGTGPFRFAERFSVPFGSGVEIVRNDDYWNGPPYLDGIRFTPISDADRTQALIDGEVDFIYGPETTRLNELRAKGFIVSEGAVPYLWYFIFNTRDKPFSDKRVRQAVMFAFDRQRLSDEIFAGATSVMTGILPPASPSYEASFPELYPYDPARAKALLAEAGYPDGFKVTVITAASGSAQLAPINICESLARDLAKVGIEVKIERRDDWGSYCDEWRLGIPKSAGLSEMSWGMSCDVWIEQVAHSRYLSPGGFNVGYYNRPEFDRLLDSARTEMAERRRTELYREAHRLIMEDAALLPVVTIRSGMVAYAPHVRNFKFPRQNWHDFKRVWIDSDA